MNNLNTSNSTNIATLSSDFDYNNLSYSEFHNNLDKLLEKINVILSSTIKNHLQNDLEKSFIWFVKILNFPRENQELDQLTAGIMEAGEVYNFNMILLKDPSIDTKNKSTLGLTYKITFGNNRST
jgi:hypothetical protein